MRKASTLIGLTLVALGAGARAEDSVPAAAAATPAAAAVAPSPTPPAVAPAPTAAVVDPYVPALPPPQAPRVRIGLSFLPMGLGKYTSDIGGLTTAGDALFAYGFGLSADYRIFAGLSAGIAPQKINNVNYKVNPNPLGGTPAVSETDYMLRLAYTFPVEETIGLYVEALPGYSHITQPNAQPPATGFVFGFGAGADMEITNRIFANLGGGYQWGFQSINIAGDKFDTRTRYVRVNLGGGVRF
jgi:hypothetical protein